MENHQKTIKYCFLLNFTPSRHGHSGRLGALPTPHREHEWPEEQVHNPSKPPPDPVFSSNPGGTDRTAVMGITRIFRTDEIAKIEKS